MSHFHFSPTVSPQSGECHCEYSCCTQYLCYVHPLLMLYSFWLLSKCHLQVLPKTLVCVPLLVVSIEEPEGDNFRTRSNCVHSSVVSLCFCSVWWISTWIDFKVTVVDESHFWEAVFCCFMSRDLLTSNKCSVVGERNLDTSVQAFTFILSELLKCVSLAFSCICYRSLALWNKFFLVCKLYSGFGLLLCLRQSFVLQVLWMLRADTRIA